MEELAQNYNLTLWATINTDEGKSYQYMDARGINVIFHDWDKSFELKWMIPRTIFTVGCPRCSPYDLPGHFDKMYKRFFNVIIDLEYRKEEI